MASPTSRSLNNLRKRGWTVGIVEKYNSFTKQRIDLFSFGDLFCFWRDYEMIVQSTTTRHIAERLEKIRGIPEAWDWLSKPSRIIRIHGWSKQGPRGKRKVWKLKEVNVTREMIGARPKPKPKPRAGSKRKKG